MNPCGSGLFIGSKKTRPKSFQEIYTQTWAGRATFPLVFWYTDDCTTSTSRPAPKGEIRPCEQYARRPALPVSSCPKSDRTTTNETGDEGKTNNNDMLRVHVVYFPTNKRRTKQCSQSGKQSMRPPTTNWHNNTVRERKMMEQQGQPSNNSKPKQNR